MWLKMYACMMKTYTSIAAGVRLLTVLATCFMIFFLPLVVVVVGTYFSVWWRPERNE